MRHQRGDTAAGVVVVRIVFNVGLDSGVLRGDERLRTPFWGRLEPVAGLDDVLYTEGIADFLDPIVLRCTLGGWVPFGDFQSNGLLGVGEVWTSLLARQA